MTQTLFDLAQLALWGALWFAGGYLLARRAFTLRPAEQVLVGLAVGLTTQNWLANLLARVAPVPLAFWLSAGLVLAVGLVFWWPWRTLREILPIRVSPWQIGLFVLVVYLGISTGRGLAIFDDYQNLPMTSLIATGDIPPRFALDPAVRFGYHHFTLLFAAQFMRVGGMEVWAALDVARGLALGLSVTLAGLWAQRITASRAAGVVGGLVYMFGMGTRWLLLLLPAGLVEAVSKSIPMLGTGLASGPTLSQGLTNIWQIEGNGPLPFPFAFANGVFQTPLMNLNGTGEMWPMIAFTLLLTATRWRGWRAWALTVVLWASFGLLGEAGVVMGVAAWGLLAVWYAIRRRTLRLPRSLWAWLSAVAAAGVFILLQGGVISELFLSKLSGAASGGSSYFDASFPFTFPPALMSAQLGSLSLFNPAQLLVALFEVGPVILVFPLVVIWMLKAARGGRWYYAAVSLTGILGVTMLFVQYAGSAGVSATVRLQWLMIGVCQAFAVPLVWLWAQKRSQTVKIAAALLGFVMILGGVVEAGFQAIAIQKPVASTFLGGLDYTVMRAYWNKLEPGAVIFDPNASRPAVVFGRATNSHITWYSPKPEWEALTAAPTLAGLRAAGFSYAYIDKKYWEGLKPASQQNLKDACIKRIQEWSRDNDFRWLLDLRSCR